MSKRLRNKRGKQGKGKRNTQFSKEHGRFLAKNMVQRTEPTQSKDDLVKSMFG